jgi:hypothetical protein
MMTMMPPPLPPPRPHRIAPASGVAGACRPRSRRRPIGNDARAVRIMAGYVLLLFIVVLDDPLSLLDDNDIVIVIRITTIIILAYEECTTSG